jgi:flagellin
MNQSLWAFFFFIRAGGTARVGKKEEGAHMSFRISSSTTPMMAARYLQKAQHQLETSFSAISSGSRVSRAVDDAAGFAISENLRGQVGGTRQAKFNADMAQMMVQTAEGGLNEQNNILVRLRELAVYSASDTISDEERKFLQTEYSQLTSEFDRIAKSTRYGSKALLTGSGENFEFQVGAFQGKENVIDFSLDADTTASAVDIDGLDIGRKSAAVSTLKSLDSALSKVAGARSTFGAMQSRLQHASDALSVQAQNLEAARSQMVDVDVAEESSKLAAAQVQQQASIAVVAQANQSGARALQLLTG